MTELPHIIIVGGGFGGLRCARDLGRLLGKAARVTIVSEKPDFEYYASLYRAATGGSPDETRVPLRKAIGAYAIDLVEDRVDGVDPSKRIISGESGKTYAYDYLVLSPGSEPAYFGIAGIQEHAYTLKSMADALRLKQHLHDLFEHGPVDARIVVIGGGPTGVETSGEFVGYVKEVARRHGKNPNAVSVDLVEALPRLLPMLSEAMSARVLKRMRKLGVNVLLECAVEKLEGETLFLKNGQQIHSKTVIWTAGVKPSHLLSAIPALTLDKKGRVEVDEQLRAKGVEHMYVVGDAASTQYVGLAQTAVNDANYVAHAIAASLQGKQGKPYVPRKPDTAVPVGAGWAVVVFKGMPFWGWIGWMMRRAADLHAFQLMLPLPVAIKTFLRGERRQEECPRCLAAMKPSRF